MTLTKKGPGKATALKQLQATTAMDGAKVLIAQYFNEIFDFKASLFYETSGKCIPKVLRLNVNRVCRLEDSNDFSVTLLGYVQIPLHDIPNTGNNTLHVPLTLINTNVTGIINVKLTMFDSKAGFDLDDDASVSSIGSNLSFMHKENASSHQSKNSSRRTTVSNIPEAGRPKSKSRSAVAELETALAEISIVKMHLDKALADKANMEALRKDELKELALLRLEVASCKDSMKGKDELIAKLQRDNDMLCKAMNKIQESYVEKEKELKILKQERKEYLKNDRILDLKDKALLAELTKTKHEVSNEFASMTSNPEDSNETSDGQYLFKNDEVDHELLTSLKERPTKAILFNDDVVELLNDHMLRKKNDTSNSKRHGAALNEKRPSLFNDDDVDIPNNIGDESKSVQDENSNRLSATAANGGVLSSFKSIMTKGSNKQSQSSVVQVRSSSPSGYVTYTPSNF